METQQDSMAELLDGVDGLTKFFTTRNYINDRGKVLIEHPIQVPPPTGYKPYYLMSRRVMLSHTWHGYEISTIEALSPFLVPDMEFRWETLVTAPDGTQSVVARYPSKKRAKKGHRILERAFGGKYYRQHGGKLDKKKVRNALS